MKARVHFESLGRRDCSLGRLSIRRTLSWPEWAWQAYKRGFFWQYTRRIKVGVRAAAGHGEAR